MALLFALLLTALSAPAEPAMGEVAVTATQIELPPAHLEGDLSVERALARRRSLRRYAGTPPTLAQVAQLLWAAQGVTDREGHRTAPSAGALYPLEVTLVVGEVEGLAPGLYRYRPENHTLVQVAAGDHRPALGRAARGQSWVARAPASLVLAAVHRRTAVKYGSRAPRYVQMEVGCAAENVYLQAESLGLGTVFVGAFDDQAVQKAVQLAPDEEPLAILPFGRRP